MPVDEIVRKIIISALPILFAIVLHEVAHGYTAFKLGDPTAKFLGRLTLNPISHIDIFGTIIMPILLYILSNGQFVIGYAKPVPIDPSNFRNPKRDMALCAASGPLTNILLATLSFLFLKYVLMPISDITSFELIESVLKPFTLILTASISINVILASFNLLPVPPLDGGRILMGFLPHRQAIALSKIEPYGFLIVIILVIAGISNLIVLPIARFLLSLIKML
ncbi:MAG: site-2 protease family protein [Thermodesulfovibrionales bacterium]|nr:site-2 protease family protein [Thermodesulfovibrionales bacterium]